jgi:2-C-methyl-D-erythritol 4-phosphate cytidylyltransferase/2-C-methyl-D-erythritol 2,4-cyclodiphosphate synthase
MKLGGVPIPGAPEVIAHSDGDVLLHALMDAILGCACRGDIGRLFPDSDPRLENINSAILLDEVLRIAVAAGVELVQADCTILAQIPRVAPHSQAIRRNLSRLLGLDEEHVNVKATTEEGLGFTGAGEGIKAVALVSAFRDNAAASSLP